MSDTIDNSIVPSPFPSAVDNTAERTERFDRIMAIDPARKTRLTGMFQDWYLDYASYVILERAVPHLDDGLKPVQRRILHTMKRMDDGRYTKVANIQGRTMEFHPHGDASIGDALVQLGQKDLLIDTQGNWGNIFTGDGAAAPRYIEARLAPFANEIAFNPKITEYVPNYDGRLQEPVTLPVKFPLLLAQGVEGIAVGLASKILPHNFNELLDACIAVLENRNFTLYPDFPTGGIADVSRYNDGLRGGVVRVRSVISKRDSRTLVISQIPYGKTTAIVIDSILKANDRGKIKLRKVDDNTAEQVEIVVHLAADASADKTIDALYAFTDCEASISPNACVIGGDKPLFIGVSDILRHNVEHTLDLLRQELQIRLAELANEWHLTSLEKIFFEERIYKELEKDLVSYEEQLASIHRRLNEYRRYLKRDIERQEVEKLCEKPVRRISRFDIKAAEERLAAVCGEMDEVNNHLEHLNDYAVAFFRNIKKKYGKGRIRRTQLAGFESIEAVEVAVANVKLYINRKDGFAGIDLRRDPNSEYVCECSDIDDIIVFTQSGKYMVARVSDKAFFGKNIVYAGVYKRNDTRTIYNVIYRNGKHGAIMYKRFAIGGITRSREYDVTQGAEGSEILWITANGNGEAEKLQVVLRPRPRLKNLLLDVDFSSIEIKGRSAQGNIVTRYPISKIRLIEKGASTLGGQKIWFDGSVKRLNTEGRGIFLGALSAGDLLAVVSGGGTFRTTSFELVNRYDDNPIYIKRFNPSAVLSAVYFDAEQKYYYLKRFTLEPSANPQPLTDPDNGKSYILAVSDDAFPQVEITFGGKSQLRPKERINVSEFIGVKGFRAKGKRLTTHEVLQIRFIEPLRCEDSPAEDNAGGEADSLF